MSDFVNDILLFYDNLFFNNLFHIIMKEYKALQKKLVQLEMENEILKKLTTFYIQNYSRGV